jgi:hypothetical protein
MGWVAKPPSEPEYRSITFRIQTLGEQVSTGEQQLMVSAPPIVELKKGIPNSVNE